MIDKKELIEGTLNFIDKYERLPYLKEDDIEVEKLDEDNEVEIRVFRSNKYIKEHFGSQDKFTKYLLDNDILKLEVVSRYIGVKPNRLQELLSEKAEDVSTRERRSIHVFFNNDYYEKLGKFSGVNDKCKKECQFPYWVDVISCGKHSKSDSSKKKESNKKYDSKGMI